MELVGRNLMIKRKLFWLKKNLDSMLGKTGFHDATEMGGFALESPRSILGTRTFLDIHLHLISIGLSTC